MVFKIKGIKKTIQGYNILCVEHEKTHLYYDSTVGLEQSGLRFIVAHNGRYWIAYTARHDPKKRKDGYGYNFGKEILIDQTRRSDVDYLVKMLGIKLK